MSWLRSLGRAYGPNPFLRQLKRHKKARSVLILWNRGLGDIPLGLYALVQMIRSSLENPHITFATRSDLVEGFSFLHGVELLEMPHWRRGEAVQMDPDMARQFDWVIEKADPTYWCRWQLKTLTPRLVWNEAFYPESWAEALPQGAIAFHVHSETSYGYEKNWPTSHVQEALRLFKQRSSRPVFLLGAKAQPSFPVEAGHDLRGRTNLRTLLWILTHRCSHLLAPDSGILSFLYYLDLQFPIRVVSLWGDPKQGILKQGVPSPNLLFDHIPLLAPRGVMADLTPEEVVNICLQTE